MISLKMILLWVIMAVSITANASLSFQLDRAGKLIYVLKDQVSLNNSKYLPLMRALESAKKGEVIKILIVNNRGGSVVTMNMITNKIKTSKALVKIYTDGYIASAAAYLAFQGDITYMPYRTRVLFHTGSVCLGEMCFRLAPSIRHSMPSFYQYYLSSIKNQKWIYKPGLICLHPGMCMYNPFKRTVVSRKYWEYFKTGEDAWTNGREICSNMRGWIKQTRNGDKYCVMKGLNYEYGK